MMNFNRSVLILIFITKYLYSRVGFSIDWPLTRTAIWFLYSNCPNK